MQFLAAAEALDRILGSKGPFISVYLPFGIRGIDELKMETERKNVLKGLKDRLDQSHDNIWEQRVDSIRDDLNAFNPETADQGVPLTLIYFCNSEFIIRTVLPALLRPHFSFANFGEIEPLVYHSWVKQPYFAVGLDTDRPFLIKGCGGSTSKATIEIPSSVRTAYANDLASLSFDYVIEIADRNRGGSPDIDISNNSNYFGYGSRRKDHSELNIDFWLKIIGEVVVANVEASDRCFLVGSDNMCERFSKLHKQFRLSKENYVSHELLHDQSKVRHTIAEQLVHEKIAAVDEEIDKAADLTESQSDIISLHESGRMRKLFVQRTDWFVKQPSTSGAYEKHNPRSYLISEAMKRGTKVEYTQCELGNEQGLAAIGYH